MAQYVLFPGNVSASVRCGDEITGATVLRSAGGTVYYGRTASVSATSNDGSLTSGQSTTLYGDYFFYVAVSPRVVLTVTALSSSSSGSATTVLGRASGGDDSGTINAVLASASTSVVQGLAGQNYQIASPLVIGSNITLNMTGCTVTLTATCNMLQSSAVAPTTTATDVSTTNNSATINSPTLAAAATVGQDVAVVGAITSGGGNGWLYAKVNTINTGTGDITLTSNNLNGIRANQTLSGATGYLFPRNSNIAVVGGTWYAGTIWNTLGTRQSAGYNSHLLRFRRVDGLVVRGVTTKLTSFPQGGGYAWGVNLQDCTNFLVTDCVADQCSDGVHVLGPASRGIIRNCLGTALDDHVAIGTNDAVSVVDTEGDVTEVIIDGVNCNGSLTGVKIYGGYSVSTSRRPISGVTIRGIKGSTITHCVTIVDVSPGLCQFDGLIDDVTAVPGSTYSSVNAAAGNIQSLMIRNVRWSASAPVATNGVIVIGNGQQITVDGLDVRGATTGYIGVKFNSGSQELILNNVSLPDSTMTIDLVSLVASKTLNRLSVSNVNKTAAGNVVNNLGMTTLTDISFVNVRNGSGAIYTSAVNAGTTNIQAANVFQAPNAQAFTVKHPATVMLSSSEYQTSTGTILVSGASATPVRVLASATRMTGSSTALVTRDSTQAVSVNAPDSGTVDQSILTPADGDIVNNSNATPLNGVGVAIYNNAATKWKNIYTGTTS